MRKYYDIGIYTEGGGGGSTPNLQAVCDVGDNTTTNMTVAGMLYGGIVAAANYLGIAVVVTTNYTDEGNDGIILVDTTAGDVQVTLFPREDTYIIVKKISSDANVVNIVTASGPVPFDGVAPPLVLSVPQSSVVLQLTPGFGWKIVASYLYGTGGTPTLQTVTDAGATTTNPTFIQAILQFLALGGNYVTVNSDYTPDDADDFAVYCDTSSGGIVISLGPSVGIPEYSGQIYIIKNIGNTGHQVNIVPATGTTIEYVGGYALTGYNSSVIIQLNETESNWCVVAAYDGTGGSAFPAVVYNKDVTATTGDQPIGLYAATAAEGTYLVSIYINNTGTAGALTGVFLNVEFTNVHGTSCICNQIPTGLTVQEGYYYTYVCSVRAKAGAIAYAVTVVSGASTYDAGMNVMQVN